jgi:2-methylcitrate dehydratase PrpD
MMAALANRVADWVSRVTFDDLPADVVDATRWRILDVIGLAYAGAETAFGRSAIAAAIEISPPGPCRIIGTGDGAGVTTAAFANATLPQALEFDDTHNESIVHMSSPAVAASLALAETRPISGRDLILGIAIANEISCRVGSVSTGQFHRRGFHPTGLFAPFGITFGAGKLIELDASQLAYAAGTCGSFAAGLLECWVDGTDTKFLHSGWASQSGITAAMLAKSGVTGPPGIFEGRFGLFASHLQDPRPVQPDGPYAAIPRNLDRIADRLGAHWESRNSSFKPFPTAHVLHPYVSAILRLRQQHGVRPQDVASIDCPVAEFNVSIVCEPVDEKCAPASRAHCRVSLQYTLAEALSAGTLGKNAYGDVTRLNSDVLALARKVHYYVDPAYPGPGRFKGAVRVTLHDGRVIDEVEEYNRGSAENPMSSGELRAKFDDNAAAFLSARQRDAVADAVGHVETLPSARMLMDLVVP